MIKFILHPSFGKIMRKLVGATRPWPWCLIGGRAVEVWTNPPQTPDVDLLMGISDEQVGHIERAFSENYIKLEDDAVGMGAPMLFFRDVRLKIEVDVFGAFEPLHFEIIRRAPIKTIQNVRFKVAYAEDIVILKSQAAIDTGRPADKSQRDRKAIFDIAGSVKLDQSYLSTTLLLHGWREELSLLRLMKVVKGGRAV
jgi:hypothetical protein